MVWILFVAGLALLVLGAESLVRGASKLASSLGVPPLLIGLTVVVYGTSAPEVAVSLQAALAGQADIAIGNVVGSNIFNVLFILGLSAIITPLVVSRRLVQIDVPLMIGVSAVMLLMALDGRVSRLDGAILAALIVVYTAFLVRQARKERAALLSPSGVAVAPAALDFDIPVMLAVAVACLPIFCTGHLIARWEGWLFFGYYAAYTLFLVLASRQHDALPAFSWVMALFVLPLTAITLLVLAVRARRQARRVA